MTKINKFKTFVTVLLLCVIALGSAGCFGLGDKDDEGKPVFTDDNKYVYFGMFPQTLKAEDVTITDAVRDANGYYTGSDGEKYAKQTVIYCPDLDDEDCTPEFWAEYAMNKAEDGRVMTIGQDYYFKVEPIKWRVLSSADGTYFLVCDTILRGLAYQPNYTSEEGDDYDRDYYATDNAGNILKDSDGNEIYANNYKYSNLRSYLNNDFYNSAFTVSQKEMIDLTTVDNSISSIYLPNHSYEDDPNITINYTYFCENTSDYVFALSENDVFNTAYGFSNSVGEFADTDPFKFWKTTDYAKATGAMTVTQKCIDEWYEFDDPAEELVYLGSGIVWLRTPDEAYSGLASYIDGSYIGAREDSVGIYNYSYGVVPAIRVTI